MRLIDVDVFAAELKERHENIMQDPEVSKRMKWCEAVHYGATTAIIEKMPTVEASPVVHGLWIDMGDFQSCSICKATRLKEIGTPYGKATWVKTKFCSDCGAKMDGGVSDG